MEFADEWGGKVYNSLTWITRVKFVFLHELGDVAKLDV